ncbi:hypothetical protein [Vibrio maritimus]|uniref:Uncharacterized protein n=2 Tax=Vibrio TaxID=662 RepID=A0A090RY09_9VIBR|nr:hypothetical protein JCM19235_2542 [Vibrio maritimus]
MKFLRFMPLSLLIFVATFGSGNAHAELPLKCQLNTTADQFWFYQEQLVFKSSQFVIFQNFKGRVVTQVDLKTGKFSRTTYIGEPFIPKYQMLFGTCEEPNHVLKMWHMSSVEMDQR